MKLPFSLGIDANGNYGYKKGGADTVIPFNASKYSVTQQGITWMPSTSGTTLTVTIPESGNYIFNGVFGAYKSKANCYILKNGTQSAALTLYDKWMHAGIIVGSWLYPKMVACKAGDKIQVRFNSGATISSADFDVPLRIFVIKV